MALPIRRDSTISNAADLLATGNDCDSAKMDNVFAPAAAATFSPPKRKRCAEKKDSGSGFDAPLVKNLRFVDRGAAGTGVIRLPGTRRSRPSKMVPQLDDLLLTPPMRTWIRGESWNIFIPRLLTQFEQMMYVSGETAEPSVETTSMIEDIVRQQVIELVR